MTQSKQPEVNYLSVARYLHAALVGRGVAGLNVYTGAGGKPCLPLDDEAIEYYRVPPHKRAPTLRELSQEIRKGKLATFGFRLVNDNFSNVLITVGDTVAPPPVDDLTFDAEKFKRFLNLLFSPRYKFEPEDIDTLLHIDPVSGDSYILVDRALIGKFFVERGKRPPTIAEARALVRADMADRFELVTIVDGDNGDYEYLAMRPRGNY